MNFTFTENIAVGYQKFLTNHLKINANTPKEGLLVRLLVGTLIIENNISGIAFSQNINYSSLGKTYNTLISTKPIKDALSSPLKLNNLDEYLTKTNHLNDQYYTSLIEEFCCYFYKTNQNSHTTAFIHLYRILEYISYSFPLIYSSYSRDYFGTYNKLKNYFEGSKSELLFFESFQAKVIEAALLESEIEIDFATLHPLLCHKHYLIIKTYLGDKIIQDVPDNLVSFQYKDLLKLVVDIRNRYFHFAVGGQRNIKSTDIIDSDAFFKLINEDIANWISIIYFEILNYSVAQTT